jgi:hypothetical protein
MRAFVLAAVVLLFAVDGHAQGCSMCRDTTAGSAPQLRAGLRRAIPVLAIPAILLFGGFLVAARRSVNWSHPSQGKK